MYNLAMSEKTPQQIQQRFRPHFRGWKRTAAAALLLLAGGAVVNVAVAWGVRFALRDDPAVIVQGHKSTLYMVSLPPREDDDLRGAMLIHRVTSCCDDFLSRTANLSAHTLVGRYQYDEFAASLCNRSWFQLKTSDDGRYRLSNSLVHSEYAAGWPTLSLRYRSKYVEPPDLPWSEDGATVVVGGGILHPAIGGLRHNLPLPTTPLWPGFIINTLFYALLLWLLFFAPFAARRKLRRRRGQCEKCAYPIGTSPVCTECGASIRCP